MSTHLPIRALQPLRRQFFARHVESRVFSTTPARPRQKGDSVRTGAAVRTQLQSGRAPRVTEKEQLQNESNLPDDIGLLPGTFIRKPIFPGGLSFKSIWGHIRSGTYQIDPSRTDEHSTQNNSPGTKVRLRLVYDAKYRWAKVKSTILLLRIWWMVRTGNKGTPLHWWYRSAVKTMAREKYETLYKNFASPESGAHKTLSDMCLSSLQKSFKDRIAARPPGIKPSWELRPKSDVAVSVVSNRALLLSLPGYDNTGVHQIVFRMRSTQSLTYTAPKASKSPYFSSKDREVLEYFVVQRQILRGVYKEWKVWGFVNEWDMETIAEDKQAERDLNAFQAQAT